MADLQREFEEIAGTKFWKKFSGEIERIRDLNLSKLRTGRIEEPVVQGKIWQEVHRYMDALLEFPVNMIKADEAENREARRGTKE